MQADKNDPNDVVPSNTNAKDHNSGDKLKLLFRDRHGTKSLSEQKVNDWLYKNRSFYDSVPKDLTEIPDAIWAPQEGSRVTAYASPGAADLTGNNTRLVNEGAYGSSQLFPHGEKVVKKAKQRRPNAHHSSDTVRRALVTAVTSDKISKPEGSRIKPRRSASTKRVRSFPLGGKQGKRHRSSSNRPQTMGRRSVSIGSRLVPGCQLFPCSTKAAPCQLIALRNGTYTAEEDVMRRLRRGSFRKLFER
ncbi:hypothetical protein AAHC03_013094 [Spirometra sp. Aus1]